MLSCILDRFGCYYFKICNHVFCCNFKHKKCFISNTKIDFLFPYLAGVRDCFMSILGSSVLTHDASLLLFTDKIKVNKTIIGNWLFFGADSVVMSSVRISDKIIVGLGAIVAKDVPTKSVVAGKSAKHICSADEYIEKCDRRQCLYNISDDFQKALDNDTSITIDCVKSIREKVYQQITTKDA